MEMDLVVAIYLVIKLESALTKGMHVTSKAQQVNLVFCVVNLGSCVVNLVFCVQPMGQGRQ